MELYDDLVSLVVDFMAVTIWLVRVFFLVVVTVPMAVLFSRGTAGAAVICHGEFG
jgi:hypothetical protein